MGAALQPNDKRLTAILRFIVRYKAANDGVAPTLAEISQEVGITSSSLIAYYLRTMQRFGMVRLLGDGARRGIIVPGGKWTYAEPPAPN